MIHVNTSKLGTSLTDNQMSVANTAVGSIATALNDADLILRFSRTNNNKVHVKIPLTELISFELFNSIDFRVKYEIQRQLDAKVTGVTSLNFNLNVAEKFESEAHYETDCLDTLSFSIDAATLG